MAQGNKISARVLTKSGDLIDFRDIHYISFISDETFGKPAIITEDHIKSEGLPIKVLYVSTSNVAAVEAVRES